MKNDRFHYLVEGACEKKIVEAFKKQQNLIISGKVTEFNVIQETITPMFLRTVAENTTFILVFDTDTDSTDVLEKNLRILLKFWSTSPTGLFAAYRNQGQMIKK